MEPKAELEVKKKGEWLVEYTQCQQAGMVRAQRQFQEKRKVNSLNSKTGLNMLLKALISEDCREPINILRLIQ